jgi:hypothetical protein
MLFSVVSHSDDIDTEDALAEILGQCRTSLGDRIPQAGIVFCSIDLEHDEILDGILDVWPALQLIGCTTDGEISSVLGYREDSITLVLLGSEIIDFSAAIGRDVSSDVSLACRNAVNDARAKSELRARLCITLPESLTTSGLEIVESLGHQLGSEVPVVGGTAGDAHRLVSTRQFCGREVCSDSVPILLISGPLLFSIAVESGWKPVGETGLVTKSEGPVVHEIGGQPAIKFYRRLLGEMAEPKPEFPIAILDDNGEVECLRASAGVFDAVTGAITFYADVPQGKMVQITVSDREDILDGCAASIDKALADYPSGKMPDVALLFSCASRKLLLGTRTMEEFKIIDSKIGKKFPVCGFYGYGEIGPRDINDTTSRFHNETFVSVIMGT